MKSEIKWTDYLDNLCLISDFQDQGQAMLDEVPNTEGQDVPPPPPPVQGSAAAVASTTVDLQAMTAQAVAQALGQQSSDFVLHEEA